MDAIGEYLRKIMYGCIAFEAACLLIFLGWVLWTGRKR